MYLRDALFIDEGNEDFIDKDGEKYLNFEKVRMKAAIIREIFKFQSKEFKFEVDFSIQNYVYNLQSLDEKSLYKLSCNLEPRSIEL